MYSGPDHSFSLVAHASHLTSGCPDRVEVTLGMASLPYTNPFRAAASSVAVFVALLLLCIMPCG